MPVLDVMAGDRIGRVAEQAIDLANRMNETWQFTFNDATVTVNPGDTPAEVVLRWGEIYRANYELAAARHAWSKPGGIVIVPKGTLSHRDFWSQDAIRMAELKECLLGPKAYERVHPELAPKADASAHHRSCALRHGGKECTC